MVDNEELDALFDTLTGTEDATKADKNSTSTLIHKDTSKDNPMPKPSATHMNRVRQDRAGKRRGRPRQPKETEEVHLCTIVEKELLRKIRTIATREGLQIKDVIGAAFLKAVKSYERKHGPIEGDGKTRIQDLF